MRPGDAVVILAGGQRVHAEIVKVSPDGRAMIVEFLLKHDGRIFHQVVPLWETNGTWWDCVAEIPVTIKKERKRAEGQGDEADGALSEAQEA